MMSWCTPRMWRMKKADEDEHGFFMYFDALREAPAVRALTEGERIAYLDSVVSVSAVERERDEIDLIDGCEGQLSQLPPSVSEDLPF